MVWRKEVDEIEQRRHLVEQGGIPYRIERQHERGKLTVRERIAALADPGSFKEIGGLSGSETYDGDRLVRVMPTGVVTGWCTLNGRKVVIDAEDSTVRYDLPTKREVPFRKRMGGFAETTAVHWRVPHISLLDAPGASMRTYEISGRPEFVGLVPWPAVLWPLLSKVPVVSAAMGSIGGKQP